MKSNIVLKLCAVSGSVLLAAAFVSYRAGAFGWLTASRDAQPVVPEAGDAGQTAPEIELVPVVNTVGGDHLMYSSKSGAVFIEPQQASPGSTAGAVEATVDTSVLFSGSKSLQMLPASPPENIVVAPDFESQ